MASSSEETKVSDSAPNGAPYETTHAISNDAPYKTRHTISNDIPYQQYNGMANGAPLHPATTLGSISITPEMFEAMYLGPKTKVRGELRQTLGNPTPVGLAGFLLAFTPLIMTYMGWRGAGGNGVATVGSFYFLGGLLAILSSIGEWVVGNSFPSTYFGVYGAFFLYYGATVTPFFNAEMAAGGEMSTQFLASNAFVGLFTGLFTIYAAVCALRVNVLFVTAFSLLAPSFLLFSAGQWYAAEGDLERFKHYGKLAGYVAMPVAIIGWYLLLEIMLSTVDFPIALPVGDLSRVVPSRSQLRKTQNNRGDTAATSHA